MLSATVHNINNLVSCFALLGESNALSAAAPLPLHYPLRRNCNTPLSLPLSVFPSPSLSVSLSWSVSPFQSRCSTLSLLLSVCDLIIVFAVRFLPVCLPVWLPELCCLLPPDTPPLLPSPSSHSAAPPQPLLIWLPSLFRHSSCRRARSRFGSHFQLPKLLHLLLLPLLCCSPTVLPTAPLLLLLLPFLVHFTLSLCFNLAHLLCFARFSV